MYSINKNIDNTIIIKKSRFITKIYKINSIDEVNNIINILKCEYKDATHICYAYILNGIEKCVDDGEPSGTTGLPILNVLKHNNLNYILAVVIRYFGGIKLGAGGLVRAYSNSITETLKLATISKLVKGYAIKISFTYDNTKEVDNLLKNININNKQYNDSIIYEFNISCDDYNVIFNELKKLTDIFFKEEILITKENC